MKTDHDGYLSETLRVASKDELVDLLRAWLAASGVATHLGDRAKSYKGWRAVIGSLEGHPFRLNADTTREAIERVVALNRPTPRPWEVVGTGRQFDGPIRRVLPGTADPIPDCLLLARNAP